MKKIVAFFLPLFVLMMGTSCTSQKKIVYFQGVDDVNFEQLAGAYQVRIMPNDNLHITVTALNSDAAQIFNNVNTSGNTNLNMENLKLMGYLVDENGFINFPVIGPVEVGGMTKLEATEHIRELVSAYIVNPVVNIRFINYKVTVLGEVNKPGTYTISDEKVTLPEALGLAGDMTIYGKRANVLICRETDGVKTFERIDMTTPQMFTSDYYYLQQNDIVYVQPNKARAGSSAYNQNLALGVSLLSLIVTIIAIVI